MNILPDWISERAFGGTHAAVAPTAKSVPSNWPVGLSAPAAKDVCDLLIDACAKSDTRMENTIVFLVGGAGNGKSYLANDVSQKISGKLKKTISDSMFASRSYDYKLSNGGDLLIVNDATIPRQGSELGVGGLVQDMQETLNRGGHMLACVNRGVLIGEVKTPCAKSNSPELAIVKWLLNSDTADNRDGQEWQLTPSARDQQSACYAYCSLSQNKKITHIHVAFMDTISLFEPRPFKVPALNQTVIPLEFQRAELSVLEINKDRYAGPNTIAAYKVLKEFFANLWLGVSDPVSKVNPEFCNISSLQDERLLKGVCDILRGAEIIGGMQITYRDLWGVALLALQGPKGRNSESYVSEYLDSTANLSKRDMAIAYIKLASRRFHMTIFSARLPDFALDKTEQRDFSEDLAYPIGLIMDALRKADPILGLEEVTKTRLDEKLQMLEESAGPGKLLAAEDAIFGAVWTELDEELESTLLAWINDEENGISQDERRQALSWYGKYLTRLYCCSYGQPAYYSLIGKWQQIWNKATPKNSRPSEPLKKGLHNLVFMPFKTGTGESFFPLFKPYSTPIVDGQAGSFIALSIPSNEYSWEIKTKGNSVLCELKKHGNEDQSATLALDFPLLREIHIRAVTSDGFTDAATEVAPRIERIRAKMLAIENSANENPTYKFVSKGDILLG